MTHEALVSKVWNYATVLKSVGVHYSAYIEQITYLLFLKMDAERSALLGEPSIIPERYRWEHLASKSGDALELHYRHTLEALATAGCRPRRLRGVLLRGRPQPTPGDRALQALRRR